MSLSPVASPLINYSHKLIILESVLSPLHNVYYVIALVFSEWNIDNSFLMHLNSIVNFKLYNVKESCWLLVKTHLWRTARSIIDIEWIYYVCIVFDCAENPFASEYIYLCMRWDVMHSIHGRLFIFFLRFFLFFLLYFPFF